jgi:hypothetical protein
MLMTNLANGAISFCFGKADNVMKVMKIKFGKSGDTVDAFGMRLYGEFDGEGAKVGRVSEMFSDSDAPGVIKNKRITIWFTFEKIRPYEKASSLLDSLVDGLRAEHYDIVFSSIDDLVDTTSLDYQGKPEGRFPVSQRIHGYNATGGFSATAEKKGGETAFSYEEIVSMLEFIKKFGQIVFGKSLAKLA